MIERTGIRLPLSAAEVVSGGTSFDWLSSTFRRAALGGVDQLVATVRRKVLIPRLRKLARARGAVPVLSWELSSR